MELKSAIKHEVQKFYESVEREDLVLAKEYLGRAHILAQSSIRFHLWIHWIMLVHSIQIRSLSEFFGQILRLIVTVPGHLLGKVPSGNIGWASVPLLQTGPIPEDLKDKILREELS